MYSLLNKISLFLVSKLHSIIGYGSGWNLYSSGEIRTLKIVNDYYRRINNYFDVLVVFDVGANVGKWSKLALDNLGHPIVLHLFEPQVICFEQLKLIKGVKLNDCALGSSNVEMVLHFNREGAEIASFYLQDTYKNSNKEMTQNFVVKVKKLDDYCTDEGVDTINLLKMDVEGNEVEVLKGATNLLARGGVDFIQFEFGVPNLFSRTFFKDYFDILSGQFDIYRISNLGVIQIKEYSPELEVYKTTNYIAINKKLNYKL